MPVSGRGWQATLVACGALAVLAGCSWGGGRSASSPSPSPTVSPGPPVGSIDHPRPVTCLDGATPTGRGPGASRTPGRPWAPPVTAPAAPGREDVTVGPLTLHGLRALAAGDQGAHGVHNADGWHYLVGTAVSGGDAVTVTIGAELRARAGLEFGGDEGLTPAPAVTFHACPGTATSYLGAFFVAGDGRACVPLDIRVGDGAPQRVVVSFFSGRCLG